MKIYMTAFVLLLAAGVMWAGENAGPKYVLQVDDAISWTVTNTSPKEHISMRAHTEPPFGLPGVLSRFAVFRQGEFLGFVRVRMLFANGCSLGRIGGSMDPTSIVSGDVLKQFRLVEKKEAPSEPLGKRETRRIDKAVSRLGDESYKVREEASEYLESVGPAVIPFVQDALASDDPEVKRRALRIQREAAGGEREVEPELAATLLRWQGKNLKDSEKGFIGISMTDASGGKESGTLVLGIVKDTPAEKAGLRNGDVILAVDGLVMFDSTELQEVIQLMDPGTDVKLEVRRGDKTIELDIKLMARPKNPIITNK
jgi:hypothetical protein